MSKRNVFNRYSTLEEKLNYLNKQQLKRFQENYNSSNIAQTISYQDINDMSSSNNIYVSSNQAFLYEGIIQNSTGYTNTITVDQSIVLNGIGYFAITNTVQFYEDENGVYTTTTNLQPIYIDNKGLELAYSYNMDNKNYYNIISGNSVSDGTYYIPFSAYANSTTFTIPYEIYVEQGQVIYGYGNLLTD